MVFRRRTPMLWIAVAALSASAAYRFATPPPASAATRPAPIQQSAERAPVAKQVGTIKSIGGNTITLTTDAGTDVAVQVAANAKMVRVSPGQTDLKSAPAIQFSDLHIGDRILVRGQASSDGKSFVAIGVIAMSRSDVEAKHASDREDWQKRGIGGLVKSVDPATGTITISLPALGGVKEMAIHTTKSTILRRYAPDSIAFDDAKPAPLTQIQPGDQLRARGARSADGGDFSADEVVSGTFRNIAGTISSVDSNANTMTVMDLLTKKPFTVRITSQSQLRRLPPEAARRIAFRLKGPGAAPPAEANANAQPHSPRPGEGSQAPEGHAGGLHPAGGQADFQQIVNRMPAATLADFKKDDAVMVVATEGTASGVVTAITLLGGVEPILAAAPAAGPAMTLSPWSLGGAPAMGGDAP